MAPAQEDEDKDEGEGEDDYMTMAIPDAAPKETPLQRLRRERLAARERGNVKSRAQLEAEAAEARERALSRSLLDDPAIARRSKGFAMMAKMGFKKGDVLGRKDHSASTAGPSSDKIPGVNRGSKDSREDGEIDYNGTNDGIQKSNKGGPIETEMEENQHHGQEQRQEHGHQAHQEPIALNIKQDRGGIGLDTERKRKADEALASEARTAGAHKKPKPETDPFAYRDRVRRERDHARVEKQVCAGMRLAERLHEEKHSSSSSSPSAMTGSPPAVPASKPLKSINILWRGLVRDREANERDKRMRRELEASLTSRPRGPVYDVGEGEEDDHDRMAMPSQDTPVLIGEAELDEEDEELEEFQALDPSERLRTIIQWLRTEHWYCFWCKCAFDDAELDGCPGETEEEHD